ncbi:hypothetical protein [Plantactinospora sp. CA-290183]
MSSFFGAAGENSAMIATCLAMARGVLSTALAAGCFVRFPA